MSNLEPSEVERIPQTSSSIKLTQRHDQSKLSLIAQKAVKTFSKTILKTHPPVPSGSPQLTPHHSTKKHCHITEHQIADTYIYTYAALQSPPITDQKPRVALNKLYYFAGGGFRSGALKEHWTLCAELCKQLPEYEINVVSYPLAPNSPATHSLPHLRTLYDTLALQARDEGGRITLMGDSAGGNIALVLGIYGATQWLRRNGELGGGVGGQTCPLRNIMVMSPPTDFRNTHPGIDQIDHHDPILSRSVITEVAERWRHELSAEDPTVSPLLADLSVFKKADVQVNGVVGLYDCLAPDSVEFRKKLEREGVSGEWLEWDKQMHCFPLTFAYRISEGVFGKDWMIDVLRRNLEQ